MLAAGVLIILSAIGIGYRTPEWGAIQVGKVQAWLTPFPREAYRDDPENANTIRFMFVAGVATGTKKEGNPVWENTHTVPCAFVRGSVFVQRGSTAKRSKITVCLLIGGAGPFGERSFDGTQVFNIMGSTRRTVAVPSAPTSQESVSPAATCSAARTCCGIVV